MFTERGRVGSGARNVGAQRSEAEELAELRERIEDRMNRLQTVIDKLELYDLAPSSPDRAVAGTPTEMQKYAEGRAPVINIYNSTFGTLNTGEVLGSIHSHVAAVTGSASADAFRQAVNAFAAQIAEDSDPAQDRRQEVLESVNALAEEAGRPSEKRRLGVIRPLLSAIPDAITVSAKALAAWDKYGGPIRAHLGL